MQYKPVNQTDAWYAWLELGEIWLRDSKGEVVVFRVKEATK